MTKPGLNFSSMKLLFKIYIVILLFSSCAKIPIQSVNLMDALMEEGTRMHQINISFLNGIFKAKKEKVDEFIKTKYTPHFIEELQKNIPPETNMKAELPNILNHITPLISQRRDSMQNALEEQRIKLSAKLETDYRTFSTAATELRMLLVSAAKLDTQRQQLFDRARELTKGSIDFDAIENSIDRFIGSGGNIGNDVSELNNTINSIIKK